VNVISRLGRFWATILCATVGVVLSGFSQVYENTPGIVTEIGYAFAPIGGVLLAHYVVLSRWRLDLIALYDPAGRYRYLAGINPIAVIVSLAGYLVATNDIIPGAWMTEVVIAIVSGAVYAVAMKLAAQVWAPAAEAIDHETMLDEYDEIELGRVLLGR